MRGFSDTVLIERTPTEVFDFATDLDHIWMWLPGLKRIDRLTGGPSQLGTKFIQSRQLSGFEHLATVELTTFERPHRVSVTSEHLGVAVTYHYTVEPVDGRSRVLVECELEGHGFAKLLMPVVAQLMKQIDGNHLTRFKAALEGAINVRKKETV